MGAAVIASLVIFGLLIFASGQQYSNLNISFKPLNSSAGAVQNASLLLQSPVVQSAYTTFSRHTTRGHDTTGSSFNDLSSYGSRKPTQHSPSADINSDLSASHSDFNYNTYETDGRNLYHNNDQDESGEDEQTFYSDLDSYKHYKSSSSQAHEGPYQLETINTQSYHKNVPAFDVSEYAHKDEEHHQEKGEVHYHQHKHVHKHEHKQEHVHQHKQEHKHHHGHKHQHSGHHEHKHNSNHKHQHHSDHKHQHHGNHKHEHHSEHKHKHHGDHKHQHHADHKHQHHGEHKHQHNSEHKHQHHGEHKHQHQNKHHHDHKHHDDHKHSHTHEGHKYKK